MRLTSLAICSAIFMASATTAAVAEADPAKGGKIARELCVRCHNVEPGGPFKLMPPSFAAISVYRTDEQIFARIMFPPLHAGMPEIGAELTPFNVAHLVAYIRSLEAR